MSRKKLSPVTSERDPLGHTTRYEYDAVGNRTVMTDANGAATYYTYDAANRLLVTLSPIPTTRSATEPR